MGVRPEIGPSIPVPKPDVLFPLQRVAGRHESGCAFGRGVEERQVRTRCSRLKGGIQVSRRESASGPTKTATIRWAFTGRIGQVRPRQTKIRASSPSGSSTAPDWGPGVPEGGPDSRRLTRLTNWSGRKGLVMKSAAP